MAQTFLSGSNPVLLRELRAGLRNARAFAMMALYVAILGAIVTVNFPANEQIDLRTDGGARGQSLFWSLVWGQILLVLALIPALSTGALAQERERRTLEPLLLTPLSPLQIVWGKAGGVLSLVGLLLLASAPLTSLCFVLGGVDTGMFVAAYAAILGLAVFTTGFGLYCAARWPSATRAMMACYALLPVTLSLVLVFLPLGALFSGMCVLAMLVYGLFRGWKKGEKSAFARKMGPIYGKLVYLLAFLMIGGLLATMYYDTSIGLIVIGVGFVLSYFVLAAQWGLLQTARELMLRNDPEAPLRQKVADFKADWQNAVAAPPVPAAYTPAPQTQGEWAALSTSATPATAPEKPAKAPKSKDSYGKAPFLSDKLNPIFAREMRSGMLGKFEYLFRFSYVITILSELGLLAFLLYSLYEPTYLNANFESVFMFWGRWHLALLMVFGAWFGARAIAPEREGQTLSQLFTIPMPPSQIINGKLAAVLAFTFYVQVLAIPLALLMAMTGLIPWGMAGRFVAVETVLAVVAASWGIFCSFHATGVRNAMSLAIGGVAILLVSHLAVEPLWEGLRLLKLVAGNAGMERFASLFPMPLLFPQAPLSIGAPINLSPVSFFAPWVLLGYALLAAFLVLRTARNFHNLAREA